MPRNPGSPSTTFALQRYAFIPGNASAWLAVRVISGAGRLPKVVAHVVKTVTVSMVYLSAFYQNAVHVYRRPSRSNSDVGHSVEAVAASAPPCVPQFVGYQGIADSVNKCYLALRKRDLYRTVGADYRPHPPHAAIGCMRGPWSAIIGWHRHVSGVVSRSATTEPGRLVMGE